MRAIKKKKKREEKEKKGTTNYVSTWSGQNRKNLILFFSTKHRTDLSMLCVYRRNGHATGSVRLDRMKQGGH